MPGARANRRTLDANSGRPTKLIQFDCRAKRRTKNEDETK